MAGIGDLTGSIEVGKCADLIVTAKNPLEDLRALRNVEIVFAQGMISAYYENTLSKGFVAGVSPLLRYLP